MSESPFGANPFATKRNIDFTQGLPQAKSELPERKKMIGGDDDQKLMSQIFSDQQKPVSVVTPKERTAEDDNLPTGPGTSMI